MIKAETMHTITCDGCKTPLGNDEYEYLLFESPQDAWDAAWDHDWTTDGHRYYCPACIKDPPGGES